MNQARKLFSFILFLAAGSLASRAQDVSNKGKEFWVGYGHHQFMENLTNTQEMVIYLSAEQPATVTVSIDSSLGSWSQTFNIPANTVVTCGPMPKAGTNDCRLYDVPISFGGIGGEGVFRRKGIHIVADTPIVAYAHIYGSASSGASMLTPVESWGHNYITANSDQVYANNCFSWFYVIAYKDSTLVEITPSVPSVLGRPANTAFTVMLMKGQIYQYTAAIISGSNGYNASGSKIKSIANASGNCFPIAVFAGSSRTTNPAACGSGGGDNDNQQCFPTQAWGKKYLTAPTSSSTSASTLQTNNYRILVKDPTTIVKRNGVVLTGIINNAYYKYESNTADLVEADKPIMVAQHMTGGGCSNGPLGDPEMIYISPVEQAIKRVGFYRNTRESIQVNYLTMIVPASAVGSVRIDGSAAVDYVYNHPQDANYRVVVKRWTAAQAQCIVTCDSNFTAITYGLGSVESYGYNAGTFLKNLNVVGSIRNPADSNSTVQEHLFTCQQTPVKISAFIRYKPTKLVWQVSQVGPQISPNADVTDNAPVPVDSTLLYGVKYYKYSLPGTYTFSDTGTFYLPVATSHPTIENCYFTETIRLPIVVKARPKPNFTFAPSAGICELDTITFTGQTPTLNGYNVQQYKWTFPGPALDSGQIVKRILPAGNNNVNLRIVTTEGCVWDTVKVVTTYAKPVADFTISPANLCLNNSTTFTDNSSYGVPGAITSWYWDFGNGTTLTTGSNTPQNQTYNNFGNIVVKHVAKVSNTCVSDTVTKILPVFARPFASFTFPTGCLPTNGQITFTNTSTISDAQTLSYVWDFGDATPTSTAVNATHNYAAEGTYNVKLSVLTNNSCPKDTTIAVTIKITPALNFPALAPVCQSASALSIATATVTNGVTGTGVYSGPGTNAAGSFNPAVAGAGTHTIWYVFTTTGGCKDSVSQTITVRARPFASFTFPTGCLPTSKQITFTNASTVSDAQTLSYVWDFGDATPTSTATNPIHTYANEGTYNVKLTVTTNNGCIKDTTVAVTIKITPAVTYNSLLAPVCESGAAFSVANGAVTNGVTGTGVYSGPGTTAAGMFNPLAAGAGIHTIWYVFTTTGGCKDSAFTTIQVRARPFASFTFPTGCLPTNGQIAFTNTSTIADAQLMAYVWNFGDATPNSTLTSPTHIYAAEGTYNVKLNVSTEYGCVKDTTIAVPVKILPALTYGALTPVCASVTTPVSVALASVTNGVTGTGVYSGPGTTAAGLFNPAVAGAGNHTIWYIFTTTGGCKDSVSRNMQVQPKPTSAFTAAPDVCLNQALTITDNSTIGVGSITSWRWDFGDGNTAVYANGNPFSKTYNATGPFTIKLVTISSNGCVSDTATRTVNVRPLPVASFNMPASICFPNNPVQFTNNSTIADNSALSYSWNFGDASPLSTVTSPGHVYAAIGSYNIRLTATSAFGCTDDSVRTFSAFFNKPIAAFTVTPDTLCQGTDNVFTDQSTAPNNTIQGWKWLFADGSTATAQNPVKRYVNPGNYNVQLIVTNAVGCISDTFSKPVIVYLQPVIDAGPSFTVPQGTTIQFNATANATGGLSFVWNPNTNLSNANTLKPTLVAMADQLYILTAIGQGNCSASDYLEVKIMKPVKVPNAFSPNGDRINDTWVITNIADYPGATVEVFNRYGQSIYYSEGYSRPWDGTFKGTPLPVGTYYYIIQLKNGFKPLNGSLTIIR